MGLLTDRGVEYRPKLIRANAVDVGHVIKLGDDYGVVLTTTKALLTVHESDTASRELLDEIKQRGAEDKVSPHFDEIIMLEVATASFDEAGNVQLVRNVVRFPEWALVHIYE